MLETTHRDNSGDTVDVAFITINYNTKGLVESLVAFLNQAELPFSFSITVVDNNSSDGSLDNIGRDPRVRIIRNERNLGYGAAANKGVEATKSRYVCVLNTDVILNNEALAALWRHLEANGTDGMCTPVVRYGNGRIQVFSFKFSLLLCYWEFLAQLHTKMFKLRLGFTRRPFQIDGVTGALLFLRRACIDGDTLFDEDFFFYFEDTDLSFRWKKKGYGAAVLPDHSIVHLGGQSGKGRNNSLYYKGKYMFLRKHYGDGHAARIKRIDFWKVARKVLSYRLLSCILPTRRIKQKLASYGDYLQVLKSER